MQKKKKNSPPVLHLLQAHQAPVLPYAKVVGRPGTKSYPAPSPDPPPTAVVQAWGLKPAPPTLLSISELENRVQNFSTLSIGVLYGWQIIRTGTVALGGKFSNVHSNQDFPRTEYHSLVGPSSSHYGPPVCERSLKSEMLWRGHQNTQVRGGQLGL